MYPIDMDHFKTMQQERHRQAAAYRLARLARTSRRQRRKPGGISARLKQVFH